MSASASQSKPCSEAANSRPRPIIIGGLPPTQVLNPKGHWYLSERNIWYTIYQDRRYIFHNRGWYRQHEDQTFKMQRSASEGTPLLFSDEAWFEETEPGSPDVAALHDGLFSMTEAINMDDQAEVHDVNYRQLPETPDRSQDEATPFMSSTVVSQISSPVSPFFRTNTFSSGTLTPSLSTGGTVAGTPALYTAIANGAVITDSPSGEEILSSTGIRLLIDGMEHVIHLQLPRQQQQRIQQIWSRRIEQLVKDYEAKRSAARSKAACDLRKNTRLELTRLDEQMCHAGRRPEQVGYFQRFLVLVVTHQWYRYLFMDEARVVMERIHRESIRAERREQARLVRELTRAQEELTDRFGPLLFAGPCRSGGSNDGG